METEFPTETLFGSKTLIQPNPKRMQIPDVFKHIEESYRRNVQPEKVQLKGVITSEIRGEYQDVYFDIEWSGMKIQALVPREQTGFIPIGFEVIVVGYLTLKARRNDLLATIKGDIVDVIATRDENSLAPERLMPKRNFFDFLAEFGEENLAIIGSDIGIEDLDRQLKKAGCYPGRFKRCVVKVTNPEEILSKAREYSTSACGLLIVRGGGNESGIHIWNRLSFISNLLENEMHLYLGIGHTRDKTKADEYADQVFATPTEAGMMLARSIHALRKHLQVKALPEAVPVQASRPQSAPTPAAPPRPVEPPTRPSSYMKPTIQKKRSWSESVWRIYEFLMSAFIKLTIVGVVALLLMKACHEGPFAREAPKVQKPISKPLEKMDKHRPKKGKGS